MRKYMPPFLDGAGYAPICHVEILVARLGRARALNELLGLLQIFHHDSLRCPALTGYGVRRGRLGVHAAGGILPPRQTKKPRPAGASFHFSQ